MWSVRGEGAGQTRVQRSHERPSAGWPHCLSRSHPVPCCPTLPHTATLSLDASCCPTPSVNAPLCPCCPLLSLPRLSCPQRLYWPWPGRPPPSPRRRTRLHPPNPAGARKLRETLRDARRPLWFGRNAGRGRAAPTLRKKIQHQDSGGSAAAARIRQSRGAEAAEAQKRFPPRQRPHPRGPARRRWTPRQRLGGGIAPLSGARPGLAERERWGAERRRHGPATRYILRRRPPRRPRPSASGERSRRLAAGEWRGACAVSGPLSPRR